MVARIAPFDFDACHQYLEELLAQTAVSYDAEQLNQLTTLIEMLNTWNGALNLTAIKEVRQMVLLHVVDSAVLVPVLRDLMQQGHSFKSVADVGTGAGFPGLVLAILCPLINKRCEEIKHEPFDCIVSRAFAPLERMVGWCLPLLASEGRFVAMKANLEADEIQAVPITVTIESVVELQVPTLDAKRQAVILRHAEAEA